MTEEAQNTDVKIENEAVEPVEPVDNVNIDDIVESQVKEGETGEKKEVDTFESLEAQDVPEPQNNAAFVAERFKKKAERERAEKEALLIELQKQQALNQNAQKQAPAQNGAPLRNQFDNEEDYIDARLEWKLKDQFMKSQAAQKQQEYIKKQKETVAQYEQSLERGMDKYKDFENKVYPILDPEGDFPTNASMGQAIAESPYSEDIFYLLGNNPKIARDIALLPPIQAVKKVAEIEQKFKLKLATKKTTQASAVIEPLTKGTGAANLKKLEDYSQAELDRMPSAEFSKLWKQRERKSPW